MRGSCSCARGLALAVALVISSCSYVADGVRTAPNALGGSADASGRLDGSTANNNGYKPPHHQALGSKSAGDESLMPRQRAASGSPLPECGHACGACSPCRRVMVSFKCAETGSESCPIAYRCMCRGRFFRVPSL